MKRVPAGSVFIGDVLCDKKDDTVFCNGPLPAGTSFM
jgi:hypothetical protein